MNDVALGITHITDWQGYDHMLYLLALVARYDLRHVPEGCVVGHGVHGGAQPHLGGGVAGPVSRSGRLGRVLDSGDHSCDGVVEPAQRRGSAQTRRRTYAMAAVFGLIHGLGFSSFFRISRDETAGFIGGLFRFNLGVEIGQLVIVAVLLAMASLLRAAKVSERDQQLFVCGGAVFLSLVMALERLPW